MMQPNEAMLRVVIPSRYGSSRFPGKPLVNLAGKPMIVRVYEAVWSALNGMADIVAAVDDERIMAVLSEYKIPAVMTDNKHGSGTDRTAEVANLLQWPACDIVLNVQGDEPLISADLLRAFANFCLSRTKFSMGTIAVPVDSAKQIHDSNVVKLTVNSKGHAIAFSRAPIPFNRNLPPEAWPPDAYLRHVGVYAYRNDVLQKVTKAPICTMERVEKLEQLRALWLGIPIYVMHWHVPPPHGVDTPADAKRVDAILKEVGSERNK